MQPPQRSAVKPAVMDIEAVRALIAADMLAVNRLIEDRLRCEVLLINDLGKYIVNSGGKRLRPLLVLLCARALGYEGTRHHDLAAVIEFIHTATLLHDDVVDASDLRRGRNTANAIWGNEASVLVGDYLYSRAFQMMVAVGDMRIMEIMSDTTNIIAQGEVLQLVNCNDPDTTEERYMEVIRSKTAKLFEAAAMAAAVLDGRPLAEQEAMGRYGLHLGIAFQMVDDILDYDASPEETGKNIGDDLAKGKATLPLLYAMRTGTPAQAALIRRAITEGGLATLQEVQQTIQETGALAYTAQQAEAEARRAVDALPSLTDSPYAQGLVALAEFSVHRAY
jgi:octaprenyl-diphosphate synthase